MAYGGSLRRGGGGGSGCLDTGLGSTFLGSGDSGALREKVAR